MIEALVLHLPRREIWGCADGNLADCLLIGHGCYPRIRKSGVLDGRHAYFKYAVHKMRPWRMGQDVCNLDLPKPSRLHAAYLTVHRDHEAIGADSQAP